MADGDFPDHDPLSCPQCALRLLTHAVFLPVSVGFGMSGHSDNSVQAAAAQLGVSPATPSPIDAPTGAVSQPPDPASPSTNANSSPRVLEVGSKRAKRPPKMPVAAPPSSSSIDASSAIDPEKIAACEAFKAQGNALMAQEDYLGAIDAYTAAIDAFPPSASSGEEDPLLAIYYANRALAQQKFSNLGSAILDAGKAIEIDPTYAKAYYRRGTVHKLLGNPKQAHADFKFLLALEPHNSQVRQILKELESTVRKLSFEEAIGSATSWGARKVVTSLSKPKAREWNVTASLAVLAARRIAAEVSLIPDEFEAVLPELEEIYLDQVAEWVSWGAMQHFRVSKVPELKAKFTSGKNNARIKTQDDFYRKLFATDRNHPILNDPFLNLIDPFERSNQKHLIYRPPDTDEASAPKLFEQHVLRLGPAIVPDLDEFRSKFDVFCGDQLKYIDWTNVLAAGGSVLAALVPTPGGVRVEDLFLENPAYRSSDVDLFVYGLSIEKANHKLRSLYQSIERAVKESNPALRLFAVRTQHAVTFVTSYPFRRIQVVLRIYKSPAEILLGFDVDACCAGFDGSQVWLSPRCARALVTQSNTIDLSRRSASYEMRLFKYAKRGFSIVVPGLEKERLQKTEDRKWSSWYWGPNAGRRKTGLALLCLLEHIWKNPPVATAWGHRNSNLGFDIDEEIFERGEHGFGARPVDEDKAIKDYDAIRIPFGPQYDINRIERHIRRFIWSADNYFRKEMAGLDPEDEVTAAIFGGIDKILERSLRLVPSGGSGKMPMIIDSKKMWMIDNPSSQRMMSGSFYPITDDDEGWWNAYETAEDDKGKGKGKDKV